MNNIKHSSPGGYDVAIVGMQCNFPGAASLDEFWTLLDTGSSGITRVPEERWNAQYFLDKGEMKTEWGGFIENVKEFDADFFNISPREARFLDPQQRLLLQVVWHALENAGIDGFSLKESNTGVYTGCATGEYFHLLNRSLESEDVNVYVGLGNSYAATSGRIAYFLGTQGPAMTLDTACSSSMVAAHLACLDLLMGITDMAIVNGVSLLLNPFGYINFSRAKMLSPDGQCKTFDKRANGYVRSEGIGTIICKRLDDAVKEGHRIWGVIKGTAVNQDGISNGFTAPNGQAQAKLYQQALRASAKKAEEIDWIECHGTGTSLGDPIEVDSIQQIYANHRNTPLYLSSVKTNIGHLEATAGIASIIKVALALKYRKIPAHRNYQSINPLIKLRKDITQIPVSSINMDKSHVYHVGVSSFGITGTNSHMIIGEPPVQKTEIYSDAGFSRKKNNSINSFPFPVSAVSDTAFWERIKRLKTWVIDSKPDFNHLLSQMWSRQSHFPKRLCLLVNNTDDLIEQMGEIEKNLITPELIKKRRKIAYIFPGSPISSNKIENKFYDTSPVYCSSFDACNTIIEKYLKTPLQKLHAKRDSFLTLFAVEYSLAQMWISLGLRPSFITGYGVGEYVVAAVSGVMSLENALRLAICIDQSFQLPVEENIEKWDISDLCLDKNKDVLSQYSDLLDEIIFTSPNLRIVSSVVDIPGDQQIYDKAYFLNLFDSKADLKNAIEFLKKRGVSYFLDMGDGWDGMDFIRKDNNENKEIFFLPSLSKSDQEVPSKTIKILYEAGFSFKKNELEAYLPVKYPLYSLPLYPFDKKEYWFDLKSRRDLNTVWTETFVLETKENDILSQHQYGNSTEIPSDFYVALVMLMIKSKQEAISNLYDVKFHNVIEAYEIMTFLVSAYRNCYYGFLLIEVSINLDNKKITVFSAKISERGSKKNEKTELGDILIDNNMDDYEKISMLIEKLQSKRSIDPDINSN